MSAADVADVHPRGASIYEECRVLDVAYRKAAAAASKKHVRRDQLFEIKRSRTVAFFLDEPAVARAARRKGTREARANMIIVCGTSVRRILALVSC